MKGPAEKHTFFLFPFLKVNRYDSASTTFEVKEITFGVVRVHEVFAFAAEEHAMLLEKVLVLFESNFGRVVLTVIIILSLLFEGVL